MAGPAPTQPPPQEAELTPYLNPYTLQPPSSSSSNQHPRRALKNIVRSEAGKPPWYDKNGEPREAYLIGVGGASASGKSYVSKAILESLPSVPWVAVVSMDSFYKELTPAQSKLAFESKFDFDHPSAFDHEDLSQVLHDLKHCRAVNLPQYSFVRHQRESTTTPMWGPSIVILEGIFALYDPAIRDLLDLKLYCQTDADVMLARRIRRDIAERGRDLEGVLSQYLRFVKPSYETYVAPTARYADLIVPGMNNEVAIKVISEHIRAQLEARATKIRLELAQVQPRPALERHESNVFNPPSSSTTSSSLASSVETLPSDVGAAGGSSSRLGLPSSGSQTTAMTVQNQTGLHLPPNVIVLPQTAQLQGLLTILHDTTTPPAEFIFTCNRVANLVVELALAELPHREKRVRVAQTGREFVGTELDVGGSGSGVGGGLCSVSILRSGAVLEKALRRAIPALPLGSLLIQSSEDGEPYLYTVSLPPFLRTRSTAQSSYVLITDAQIGTGAAAFMAIRVILDHGIPPSQILFLALLASARGGVWAIHRAFPEVRIVVGGVDPGLRKMRIAVRDHPVLDFGASPKGTTAQGQGQSGRGRIESGVGGSEASSAITSEDEDEDQQRQRDLSAETARGGTRVAVADAVVPSLVLPPSQLGGDGEASAGTKSEADLSTPTQEFRDGGAGADGSRLISTNSSASSTAAAAGTGSTMLVRREERGSLSGASAGAGAGLLGGTESKTVFAIVPGMGWARLGIATTAHEA